MNKYAIAAAACLAVSTLSISSTPLRAEPQSYENVAAPATAAKRDFSEKEVNALLRSGKVSKALYDNIVMRTKAGRFYVLSGNQALSLRIRHPDIFEVLFQDKQHKKQLNAEQIKVVVALTIEQLMNIKAGQAAPATTPPATPPATPTSSGDGTKLDPDVTLMVACFGATGALFSLPHPYSYISAGIVFGGCTLLYGKEIYAKAIPKVLGQKPVGT